MERRLTMNNNLTITLDTFKNLVYTLEEFTNLYQSDTFNFSLISCPCSDKINKLLSKSKNKEKLKICIDTLSSQIKNSIPQSLLKQLDDKSISTKKLVTLVSYLKKLIILCYQEIKLYLYLNNYITLRNTFDLHIQNGLHHPLSVFNSMNIDNSSLKDRDKMEFKKYINKLSFQIEECYTKLKLKELQIYSFTIFSEIPAFGKGENDVISFILCFESGKGYNAIKISSDNPNRPQPIPSVIDKDDDDFLSNLNNFNDSNILPF